MMCAKCGRWPKLARDMCARCYADAYRRGEGNRQRGPIADDVEFMINAGALLSEIMRRLGYTKPESLERKLYREGRGDVWRNGRLAGQARDMRKAAA